MARRIKDQIKERVIPKLEAIVAEMYSKEMWEMGVKVDKVFEELDDIVNPPKLKIYHTEDSIELVDGVVNSEEKVK